LSSLKTQNEVAWHHKGQGLLLKSHLDCSQAVHATSKRNKSCYSTCARAAHDADEGKRPRNLVYMTKHGQKLTCDVGQCHVCCRFTAGQRKLPSQMVICKMCIYARSKQAVEKSVSGRSAQINVVQAHVHLVATRQHAVRMPV